MRRRWRRRQKFQLQATSAPFRKLPVPCRSLHSLEQTTTTGTSCTLTSCYNVDGDDDGGAHLCQRLARRECLPANSRTCSSTQSSRRATSSTFASDSAPRPPPHPRTQAISSAATVSAILLFIHRTIQAYPKRPITSETRTRREVQELCA